MEIHVVPGASAAATVELALGLGSDGVVALVDPLSVGPLTAFDSLEAWAWAAVTADTPESLVDFTRSSKGPLPILRRALQRLFTRYPDVGSGLSRWDGVLLHNAAAHGPRAVRVLAHTLAASDMEDDPVGDIWLDWRLRRLASTALPHPLLDLSGDPYDISNASVRLTDAGHAVLRSETTALSLNGIEDQIGGVHLSSKLNRVWVNDEGNLVRLLSLP